MKVAIIGGRSFNNYQLLSETIDRHFYTNGPFRSVFLVHEIISGGAKGADFLAAKFAKGNNIKLTEFLPDWDKHGKSAGFIRNEDIIKNSDMVLCFWDGQSKGSANSLSIAKRLKKNTIIIYY